MSAYRLLVLLALVLVGLSGCGRADPPPSGPDVLLSWRVPSDACRRLDLLGITRDAGWLLDGPDQVSGSSADPGRYLAVGCTARGQVDLDSGPAPLDGGTLALDVETATDAAGVESIRRTLGFRGDLDDAFSSRGPYEVSEAAVTGWWSRGSVRTYRQDPSGGAPRSAGVPRITRVTVSARIIDDNLTASVLVFAQVLADDARRIRRLETLAITTLRALEGALERSNEVAEPTLSR